MLARPGLAGNEGGEVVPPGRLDAGLAVQLHGGRPAPGDAHQVAGDAANRAGHAGAVEGQGRHLHPLDVPPAQGPEDHRRGQPLDAQLSGPLRQPRRRMVPGVHHGHDADARNRQVDGRPVGAVVVGEDHRPTARG